MTAAFGVLGPLEVLVDGRPVRLGGRKQRAVLAMLLLHTNETVSTERLLDEIWPASPVDAATRSLRVFVSNIRKALGEEAASLATRPGGYALIVGPEQVDASRCERLLGQGRLARSEGDHAGAAALLRDALALWRGPPLTDLTYESFAQGEIERLDELRLAVLDERIEADLALGQHTELVAELEALARQHPRRERLHRQLMLALYRSGRPSDALNAYEDARRYLRDELGLEPTPHLRELHAAILQGDAGLAVEPAELQRRRHLPAPATRLIGRSAEIADVRSLLLEKGVRLLTLTGPGGVGKTRLGLQAAHSLAERFADGVFFVGLASIQDPSLVASTVSAALGTRQIAGKSLAESVQDHLADRQLLLLLDNFEQVDEAAPLLAALLFGRVPPPDHRHQSFPASSLRRARIPGSPAPAT